MAPFIHSNNARRLRGCWSWCQGIPYLTHLSTHTAEHHASHVTTYIEIQVHFPYSLTTKQFFNMLSLSLYLNILTNNRPVSHITNDIMFFFANKNLSSTKHPENTWNERDLPSYKNPTLDHRPPLSARTRQRHSPTCPTTVPLDEPVVRNLMCVDFKCVRVFVYNEARCEDKLICFKKANSHFNGDHVSLCQLPSIFCNYSQ